MLAPSSENNSTTHACPDMVLKEKTLLMPFDQ